MMELSLRLKNIRTTKKMLRILREGNVKVEANVTKILDEIGRELEDEYENVQMVFEKTEIEMKEHAGKKKKIKKVVQTEMNVTVAKNAKELVEKIAEVRGLDLNSLKSRVVIDSGQGSLKVVVSIFNEDVEQKGSLQKLTGSNRLIILAEVEGGQERYANLRLIFDKLQIHLLPGLVMVGDLSVTNVYLGISKHGGKFACYVCEGPSTLESGVLRSFRSLTSRYEDYRADGSNPKNMQKFKNVINPCLVEGNPDELVGDKLPLPQLHLLLGTCTHFYKLLVKAWPQLIIWGKGKWTVHGRHGGGLDGANSNRFLKQLDLLATAIPRKLLPIIKTLKLFREIVTGCFSWELCTDYKDRITAFTNSLQSLVVYCKVMYLF